jgi:hypothetical protein
VLEKHQIIGGQEDQIFQIVSDLSKKLPESLVCALESGAASL